MTSPDKLMIEHVAKAIFDHEQNGLFKPTLSNFALYGKEQVTWDEINDEKFVSTCSDIYRKKAIAVIEAVNSYKHPGAFKLDPNAPWKAPEPLEEKKVAVAEYKPPHTDDSVPSLIGYEAVPTKTSDDPTRESGDK